jgi:hypothetical protein
MTFPILDMTDITCVVMTMRSDREHLIFHTTDGVITVQLKPMGRRKTGIHIFAPRKVLIRREPTKEESQNAAV